MREVAKTKKAFKMPHTFVILFIIIAAAVVLTWIVPSGSYGRIENAAGTKVVDASAFAYVDNVRVNPVKVPMLIIEAFVKNGDLIMLVLLSGGAIYMMTAAGALQALVAFVVKRFGKRSEVFIPLLMLMFALICTTQAVNTFIGFAPIMVMLALSMGFDSIVGVGIILLGGAIGFSTGTLNINTTLVAQKIAELPNYSGIGYRWICFGIYYVITCAYVVRYANKIKKNPKLSPTYELDQNSEFKNLTMEEFGEMNARRAGCIAAMIAALLVIIYGCIKMGWDYNEQSSIFLVLSIIVGIIAGFDANKICAEFMNGCKKMLAAAFIIGFARAIGSVLNAGMITDTIVHAFAMMLNGLPAPLLGVGMFFANTVINVFLTSGSGQAAAVMPIMIPLSDLLGVTRQTCVLSFNFGDGFCNYILPTSTALMGILSAGSVPYDRWMRFMWKMFAIWFVVGAILVAIAQMIGYGPM